MITYTRFDDNGKYTAVVTGLPDDLVHENSARIYLGLPPGGDHFHDIVNNVPAAMPAPPGPNYVFDYSAKKWVDPRSLADVKAAKRTELSAARLAANNACFTFAGKQIQCDEIGRSDIDGANGIIALLRALPPGWLGQWKAADNTFLPIPDLATWVAFYAAMVAQGQANFVRAQALKAQVEAATTIDALALVSWPAP